MKEKTITIRISEKTYNQWTEILDYKRQDNEKTTISDLIRLTMSNYYKSLIKKGIIAELHEEQEKQAKLKNPKIAEYEEKQALLIIEQMKIKREEPDNLEKIELLDKKIKSISKKIEIEKSR